MLRFFVMSLPLWAMAGSLYGVEKLRALIVDGQNNHAQWPKTTFMMKQMLLASGRFTVDVHRTHFVWKGEEYLDEYRLDDTREPLLVSSPRMDPDFCPNFKKYDLVVSNFGYNAAAWPKETQNQFVRYMREGGGLVVVHAADNSFANWPEYNQMIGLGGWGGRTEKSGPYVYMDDHGKVTRDTSAGQGGNHGEQHEFEIVIRSPDHPITRGLPRSWLHTKDELYEQLRGPAEAMTILATAFADPSKGGSGRHEPMLMTVQYASGRIFHTTLGHADYSLECVGFQTTLVRGAEWAATGEVTLPVPEAFPTPTHSLAAPISDTDPQILRKRQKSKSG